MSKKRKKDVPSEFPITDRMREYAKTKGFKGDIEDLTEDFLLYHQARGNQFVNWVAAWQTWLRNDIKWSKEKQCYKATIEKHNQKPSFSNDMIS